MGSFASAAAAVLAGIITTRTITGTALRTRFTRRNHANMEVTLAEGAGIGAATLASTLLCTDPAALVSVAAAGILGAYDDHHEDTTTKGLRGHLRSLAHGKVTTGGLKLLGISAAAGISAVFITLDRNRAVPQQADAILQATVSRCHRASRITGIAGDIVVDTALIAGGANLINLLDLRPGRALKGAIILTGLAAVTADNKVQVAPQAAGLLATAVSALPADLKGRAMMGDTGANALGAGIGSCFARHTSRSVRLATAMTLVGLILVSEKVSFSSVIESNRVLNMIDSWGRG